MTAPDTPSPMTAAQSAYTATASAAKRGRWPHKPYVPIVKHRSQPPGYACPKEWTQQIRPLAFATREAAIAYAQKYIDANRAARAAIAAAEAAGIKE